MTAIEFLGLFASMTVIVGAVVFCWAISGSGEDLP